MTLPTAPKRVTKVDIAIDDYTFDFAPAIASGDTPSSASVLVRSGDVTAAMRSQVGTVVTVRLSGGTPGKVSEIAVQMVTTSGERPTWTFMVQVVG